MAPKISDPSRTAATTTERSHRSCRSITTMMKILESTFIVLLASCRLLQSRAFLQATDPLGFGVAKMTKAPPLPPLVVPRMPVPLRGGGGVTAAAATPTVIDEESTWTPKRLHNSPAFRSAAVLGALLAAGLSSRSPVASLPAATAAVLHTLAFATWFGSVAYTTFVLGITAFKNLPRQTFGKLQARLFPKYFSLGSICLVLQIVTLQSLAMAAKAKSRRALVASLVATAVNQFGLEPRSTDNMLERYRMEDEGREGTGEYRELRKKFGKYHGMSSLANLVALLGGVAHACYLGSALV